eukprot:352088-Chlamydomonas_euryale.AAC.1
MPTTHTQFRVNMDKLQERSTSCTLLMDTREGMEPKTMGPIEPMQVLAERMHLHCLHVCAACAFHRAQTHAHVDDKIPQGRTH